MAITTLDQLALARPGQALGYVKSNVAPGTIGAWFSPSLVGGLPVAQAAPASGVNGEVVTGETVGFLGLVAPPSGSMYLARATVDGMSGVVSLYDRLWQNSGLSVTLLTAQAITPVALPARCPVASDQTGETFDALGGEVEPWLLVTTLTGAGAPVVTINYTNQAGVAGRTGTLQGYTAASAAGRTFPFSLAEGDTGVRSIQSYTSTVSMTSGAISLVLRRRIAVVSVSGSSGIGREQRGMSPLKIGLPAIPANAALETVVMHGSGSGAQHLGAEFIVVSG